MQHFPYVCVHTLPSSCSSLTDDDTWKLNLHSGCSWARLLQAESSCPGLEKTICLGKVEKMKNLFLYSNRIGKSISIVCYLWTDVHSCSWKHRNLWKISGLGVFFNTLSIAACALQSLLFITLQIRAKESLSCLFLCFQSSSSLALEHHGISWLLSVALEWGCLAFGPETVDLATSRLQSRRQPENQLAECMVKHSTVVLGFFKTQSGYKCI